MALTHYNRYDWLLEAICNVRDDPRIAEIVISDDASDDGSYERLIKQFHDDPLVRLYRNGVNLGPYINKRQAVSLCHYEWVLLFDSDNGIHPSYLDALEAVAPLDPDVAYLPTRAEPDFDYSEFAGRTIRRADVAELLGNQRFETALNTGNHVFFRNNYLAVFDPTLDPLTFEAMYSSYRWLRAGHCLLFVPNMNYFHRMHDQSYVLVNDEAGQHMGELVKSRLASL